jgi:hypothetical protein
VELSLMWLGKCWTTCVRSPGTVGTSFPRVQTGCETQYKFRFLELHCRGFEDRDEALGSTKLHTFFRMSPLEWSQVYRQEPWRLEKICIEPMFLMELRTLLLLFRMPSQHKDMQAWPKMYPLIQQTSLEGLYVQCQYFVSLRRSGNVGALGLTGSRRKQDRIQTKC